VHAEVEEDNTTTRTDDSKRNLSDKQENDNSSVLQHVPKSFVSLKKDLCRAAFIQCNFLLFSNGAAGNDKHTRKFRCGACVNRHQNNRQISKAQVLSTLQDNLCKSSIINDARNCRGSVGKCTSTTIRTYSCPFCFTIRWDEIGFYVAVARCLENYITKYSLTIVFHSIIVP